MEDEFGNPVGAPTEFVDLNLSVHIPINHPAEPVMVVYEDGSFEWAYDGDVEHIASVNAGTDREVVNAFSAESIMAGLHDFVQRNQGIC